MDFSLCCSSDHSELDCKNVILLNVRKCKTKKTATVNSPLPTKEEGN